MAAQAGTLTCVGQNTGRTYSIDLYLPDAVATLVTFNPGGLAVSTSKESWKPPEDVRILDITVPAAPTAVGASFKADDAVINGGVIRWANQLESLPNRQPLKLIIQKGTDISLLQH